MKIARAVVTGRERFTRDAEALGAELLENSAGLQSNNHADHVQMSFSAKMWSKRSSFHPEAPLWVPTEQAMHALILCI